MIQNIMTTWLIWMQVAHNNFLVAYSVDHFADPIDSQVNVPHRIVLPPPGCMFHQPFAWKTAYPDTTIDRM